MKFFHQLVPRALLATWLYSTGCTAGSGIAPPPDTSVTAIQPAVPDQDAVEAFTHKAEWNFPDYGEGKALVSERILIGFEAAPTRLVTADGSSIRWGSKFQENTIESVVISDASAQLKLLAAVDGVTWLTSLSSSPIDTMAEYEQRQERSGLEPSVTVFVHDEGDLKAYLPPLKRWLQASLMGFNADCSRAELASACKLAEQIAIPTKAYVIAADGKLRGIEVPDVRAASMPLKSFVQ